MNKVEKGKKIELLKGKGITKITTVPNLKKLKNYQNADYYRDVLYQCGKCGTCRTTYQQEYWARVCPSGEFGKFEAYYLGGKNLLAWGLNTNKIEWTENLAKIFYKCSVCQACMQQCQIPEIHHYAGEWLMAMREEAVNKGLGPMPEHRAYTDHILKEYNPYMENHQERTQWIPSHIKQSTDSKTAYFVGCTSSYREKSIAISTVEILNKLDLPFKILKDEHCCGSPVYMTGQTNIAKQIAETNVKTFEKEGIQKIITSCAGCYRMLKEVYPNKFGLKHNVEINHLPELLLEIINDGELKLEKVLPMKVTYHDPCHLGRHMGIYETPRELLNKIPGIELIEMVRNRYNAWCCGSGGGVRSAFKDLSEFAANERIKEAKETKAGAIISSCPFCANQFKNNLDENKISVLDIAELVRKAL